MAENEAQTTEDTPKEDPKGMRKIISEQAAEIRELKAEKRDDTLRGIGLDPTTGLGLALAESFDRGDVALNALVSTATDKYGYVVPDARETHPHMDVVTQQQTQLDQAGQQAASVPLAPTQTQALNQAEADGDLATAGKLKSEQIQSWFQRPPGG